MKERIAIIDGIRTPFCKAGGSLKDMEADDLGAYAVKELLARTGIDPEKIDELIFGNVMQPPNSTNIARIVAVKAGLPIKMPAYTVNRNCASGMEAMTTAANKLWMNEADIIIAGGTESMSGFPVLFGKKMREFLTRINKSKSWKQKLKTLLSFRPSFLKPEIPEISDPICGLTMGQTAEIISRDFKVTREDQDKYSLMSQERVAKATQEGRLAEEIVPVPIPPSYSTMLTQDEGPRANTTFEGLSALKPVFEKFTGTVTAGNSSQVTDGAAAVLLMRESTAKAMGFQPIGYLKEYAYIGLDPARMGLGPVYAISKLLDKSNVKLNEIDLIEINEAFAAQIVAVVRAAASPEFAKKELGKETPLGEIDYNKLNVNGGAVALGHPLGASGTRLVITLLKELKRRHKNVGIASLCVGGGQGEAVLLET
jgi:acetyl-CoA acyltransferase